MSDLAGVFFLDPRGPSRFRSNIAESFKHLIFSSKAWQIDCSPSCIAQEALASECERSKRIDWEAEPSLLEDVFLPLCVE